jgi:hypothetical protein
MVTASSDLLGSSLYCGASIKAMGLQMVAFKLIDEFVKPRR